MAWPKTSLGDFSSQIQCFPVRLEQSPQNTVRPFGSIYLRVVLSHKINALGSKDKKTRSFCVDISTMSRQQVKFICFSTTFRRQVQSSKLHLPGPPARVTCLFPPSSRWPGRARRTFCRRWCSRLRSPRKHVSFRRWCSSSKGLVWNFIYGFSP